MLKRTSASFMGQKQQQTTVLRRLRVAITKRTPSTASLPAYFSASHMLSLEAFQKSVRGAGGELYAATAAAGSYCASKVLRNKADVWQPSENHRMKKSLAGNSHMKGFTPSFAPPYLDPRVWSARAMAQIDELQKYHQSSASNDAGGPSTTMPIAGLAADVGVTPVIVSKQQQQQQSALPTSPKDRQQLILLSPPIDPNRSAVQPPAPQSHIGRWLESSTKSVASVGSRVSAAFHNMPSDTRRVLSRMQGAFYQIPKWYGYSVRLIKITIILVALKLVVMAAHVLLDAVEVFQRGQRLMLTSKHSEPHTAHVKSATFPTFAAAHTMDDQRRVGVASGNVGEELRTQTTYVL